MPVGQPVPWFLPVENGPCFCQSGKSFGECCGSQAPNRRPPAGVLVYSGFLDPETCENWVERLEKQPRTRATILEMSKSSPLARKNVVDPARVCFDVKPGPLRKRIDERITAGYRRAAMQIGRQLEWYETPRILRYEPGGFYQRHSDSCQVDQPSKTWYKVQDRDLSLLLYLNEDYTGGGLSFINFHFHFRPRAGDLLVFPSDNRYEHQAERVESGVRYAIASWATLIGSPRVLTGPPRGAIRF
ncbi:MAG TPA: 2OG-Fe(II) oxygenase [Xanthomonadales bacterium]|nr:2OG-Fe(II) oxygenase [Xanthomonadales bacterium]